MTIAIDVTPKNKTSGLVGFVQSDQPQPILLPVLTCIAALLAIARALLPGWGMPLWLDETYTATIATQPSFAKLIDWCLHELSGPVYYTLTWCWTHVFGASDGSLRTPGLICVLATPLLILWKGHPSRDVRMLWTILLILWIPATSFASEARPYALVMLLATAQALIFFRLIDDGSRRWAMAWSSVTALLILTHYYALPLAGMQGLLFLALRRRDALKAWPAALVFVPVGIWMLIHIPFVLSFASPGVAWYHTFTLDTAWAIPILLMGGGFFPGLPFAAMLIFMSVQAARAALGKPTLRFSRPELATVGASALAALLVIGVDFFKPIFLLRYFTPFMPGLMLGFAIWTIAMARRFSFLPAALAATVIIFGVGAVKHAIERPEDDVRNQFGLERPSTWLREQKMQRLVFYWDNTTASISKSARLGEVGSYFLHRDGWQGPVIVPPIAGKKVDPNTILTDLASQPGDGIIWAYDRDYPGTLARRTPPRLHRPGSPFTCRDFGRPHFSIVTCIRR